MIRIDWSEVEAVKNKLLRSGAAETLEMAVIVFYHHKSECDKMQIKLHQLEEILFKLSSDRQTKGIFLFDITMRKPFLRYEESERTGVGEEVPNSGHRSVVADFSKMSPEAKSVWLEIAFAQQHHYVS
jgi:hypothetical protein